MIRVYYTDAAALQDPFLYDRYYENASEDRRKKADRFRRADDRQLCIAATALIDAGLKEYGRSEKQVRYGHTEYGKPYFADLPQVYFNVSHSKNKAMAVFSDVPAGCDIERQDTADPQIICRFFHREEWEMFEMIPETERSALFFRLWTIKESYLKAIGSGMSMPLDSFAVRIREGEPVRVVKNGLSQDFTFFEPMLFPGFRSCVCIPGQEKELCYEQVIL